MNIILLSGGSGKRLWPLSNNVRSKQFIKLFKNDKGEYESMLQRVCRQIRTTNGDARITIATGKSQVSLIRNQLDQVAICVEPCRRDTFPAILLAATYLYHELGVSKEECVVVCPVDPYVEDSYYSEFERLEQLVMSGNTNLTLMGITPSYPSNKYGYIIPDSSGKVSMVKEFWEKPDVETAKEYLRRGALWNAGVFAFKLGYLLEKAHNMVEFTDYASLYKNYETLTKTSFDYAVVEKEPSIQVMRYEGSWKDVGTWNMIAEVLGIDIKGDVMMDETCVDTQIINELPVPIIAMGCKNIVIAAGNDGILVSDKERSDYIKPYVEKINREIMFTEKSWGTYSVINAQPDSMTIKLFLYAGRRMSYHSHAYRKEVWIIVSGTGKAIIDGVKKQIQTGDVLTINIGSKHTIKAESELDIIEIQIGERIFIADKKKYPVNEDCNFSI